MYKSSNTEAASAMRYGRGGWRQTKTRFSSPFSSENASTPNFRACEGGLPFARARTRRSQGSGSFAAVRSARPLSCSGSISSFMMISCWRCRLPAPLSSCPGASWAWPRPHRPPPPPPDASAGSGAGCWHQHPPQEIQASPCRPSCSWIRRVAALPADRMGLTGRPVFWSPADRPVDQPRPTGRSAGRPSRPIGDPGGQPAGRSTGGRPAGEVSRVDRQTGKPVDQARLSVL